MTSTIRTLPLYRGSVLLGLLVAETVVFYDPPFSDFQTWAITQVFLVMGIIVAFAAFLAGLAVWLHDRPYKQRHRFDDENILD